MQCEINEVECEISDNGMWNQWRWDVKLMTMGCEIKDDWDENIMCTRKILLPFGILSFHSQV